MYADDNDGSRDDKRPKTSRAAVKPLNLSVAAAAAAAKMENTRRRSSRGRIFALNAS